MRCTIDFLPNEEETSLPLGIGHFEALIRDTLLSYITEMGSTIDDSMEEMMARYAKDDYYFLEAYIDTMTKASRVGISSGSKFVAYN